MTLPLKMALARAESTWGKYGAFLNSFHPDTKWLIQRLEQINYEICRSQESVLFNETCLKEKMLPRYIYIYIYIYIQTDSLKYAYIHTHTHIYIYIYIHTHTHTLTQSTGAIEYTVCISAEEYDSSNECPEYDSKQSDDEAPIMLELWGMQSIHHCHCSQVHSGSEW